MGPPAELFLRRLPGEDWWIMRRLPGTHRPLAIGIVEKRPGEDGIRYRARLDFGPRAGLESGPLADRDAALAWARQHYPNG